jgi:hypothetical protein
LDRIARRVRELVIGAGKEAKRTRMLAMASSWRDERYERNRARAENYRAQEKYLWEHGEPYYGPSSNSSDDSPGDGYDYAIRTVSGGLWLPPCVTVAIRNRYPGQDDWFNSFSQKYPHFLDRGDQDYASRRGCPVSAGTGSPRFSETGVSMSDSQRNILLSLCGVAVVCMVAGFLLGRIATKPATVEPYSVYSHSAMNGHVINLVRHNKQTGKTEYVRVFPTGFVQGGEGKLDTMYKSKAWQSVP